MKTASPMKTVSTPDYNLIKKIADRATVISESYGLANARISFVLAILGTHVTCPLKLKTFLEFKDGDFAHDAFGILRHYDQKSGDLKDCFLPRCAK
jgi:hypothetical protein